MGAPQASSELPLHDSELSKVADGIPASELSQIAVQYFMIPQVEADRIYSDCGEKVTRTAVKYLHHWKNRQCTQQQRRGLIEILDQIRERGWISLSTYDFLKTPTDPTCTGERFNSVGAFGAANTPFQLYDSQDEQIYLGDRENLVDSTDSEFNNNGNRKNNNNVHSKQPVTSANHELSKPNNLCQHCKRLDSVPATSGETSLNNEYEDDRDQTSPIQVDRFPGNRYHDHRTSMEIDLIYVGDRQILAHHVPERDHSMNHFYPADADSEEMSSLSAHYIPPSDLHENERVQDPPTLKGYNSVDTKHVVPCKFTNAPSTSAPSTPKGQGLRKKNTMHKHRHSDGHMESSEAFVKFQHRPLRSISHQNNPKPKMKVFITYAKDDKKHLARVLEMTHFLQNHNTAVAIDVKELRDLAIDKMGWLDNQFHSVHKVIVAISPEYFRTIGGNSGSRTDNKPADVFSEQGLNTLYIYKKMQIEHRNKRCQNERFMPVIFRQSNATMDHVPTWLQNTLVYTWPEHKKNIEMHAKGCYWYDSCLDY